MWETERPPDPIPSAGQRGEKPGFRIRIPQAFLNLKQCYNEPLSTCFMPLPQQAASQDLKSVVAGKVNTKLY